MSPDAYRDLLVEPLTRETARPPQPVRVPSPAIWFEPKPRAIEHHLPDLYEMGVECGHRESLRVLGTEVKRAEQRLAALAAERARLEDEQTRLQGHVGRLDEEIVRTQRAAQEHARRLEGDMQRVRDRLTEIESSTFWRATAPLRRTVHSMKRVVRGARGLRHQMHLLGPRLGTARQIARDQGVGELARRVRAKLRARSRGPSRAVARAGLEARISPVHIATSPTPRVSVILPTYGQYKHAFSALKALALPSETIPMEVIVMDDCAPQPAHEALAQVTGVRFVRNESNLGFLRNCNAGIALAHGEFVLLLNDDAVVAPGCIEALLRIFEAHPDAGAAGAKLVYPDGTLQEAGGIIWRDASGWNDGRGGEPEAPEFNYVKEADYCSAACLLVRRELLVSLGGFDERYAPAYYEDADLCFRIREAGFKVYYQPAAEVVHFEGVSHGTDLGSGLKRHQVENQARFLQRWADVLKHHRPNGVAPRLERDRSAVHRVLFIEACMLTPDHDAGSVRTWRLIEVMQGLGAKVTFVAENLEHREPYTSDLQQAGVEVLYAPYVSSIRTLLEERGAEFDIVIAARYYVAAPHIDDIRRHAPRALLVLDTIDLHYLRQRRLAALHKTRDLQVSAETIYRQEIDCISRCDVTWVVSDFEQELLAREVPRARVVVQSLVQDPLEAVPPFAAREGLLFVGGYRHPPNVDAVMWFTREIAPLLAQRLPGVKAYLAGSNAPAAVMELQGPNIEVLGFVPDIEAWLDRCRLSISPLRYGAGVKGKVNHSMSRGVPVVATVASVEGMHLVEGEEVLVADDPQAFADAVVRAYTDESLWKRLSAGGLANVRRHFSRDVARQGLEALFALAQERTR